MSDEDGPLGPLVDAICDGEQVDWVAARALARTDADRDLLVHLQTIAAISPGRREPLRPGRAIGTLLATTARRGVIAVASAKAALAMLGCVLAIGLGSRAPLPPWPFVINPFVFGMAGWVLLWGSARDLRVGRLGALFVIIAAAYADGLGPGGGAWAGPGWLAAGWRAITVDAFLAFAFWDFVSVFPTPVQRPSPRFVARSLTLLSLAAGTVLLGANLLRFVPDVVPSAAALAAALERFDRSSPTSGLYWPTVFGLAAPALPYLLWRSRFETREDRRRVSFFTGSLAVGISPMLVAVVLSPYLPYLDDPVNRQRVGVALYVALLSMVPSTAYAVFVHRVLDVRLALKRTLQYRVARHAILLLTSVPVAVLAFDVFASHRLAIVQVVRQVDSLALLAVFATAIVVLAVRRRLLVALDRVFLREEPNHAEVMETLEQRLREAVSSPEIAGIVGQEIDRATHPQMIAVFLADAAGQRLISPDESAPPLDLATPLGTLLAGAGREIRVGRATSPIWDLLPRGDRQWLESGGFQLLLPFVGRAGRLIGAAALGAKRSGLEYTRNDLLLLRVMTAETAVTLENLRLRRLPESGPDHQPPVGSVEPARECPSCRLVWPASTLDCGCGTNTRPGVLPPFLLSKFRLERLLGTGGMGRVYLAVDLSLDRRVAIKTLLRLTPEKARRLEREARAMARVQHINLAQVFGVERWDEYPLLIVEYLEGGTLAERLSRSPMTPAEAMSLGVVLGDALDRIHLSGMLHRDIKPSNIGYSADDVPKILDFGLASLVHTVADARGRDEVEATEPAFLPTAVVSSTDHLVGTLAYMSPEAVRGAAPDRHVDLWSLALTLFETIAGVNPLKGEEPSETLDHVLKGAVPDVRTYRPDCPVAVALFFREVLSARREARLQTASAFRSHCRQLLANLTGARL